MSGVKLPKAVPMADAGLGGYDPQTPLRLSQGAFKSYHLVDKLGIREDALHV